VLDRAVGLERGVLGKENHMARSRRNEANRLTATVEAGLPDLTVVTVSEAVSNGESGAAFETLNLGYAS